MGIKWKNIVKLISIIKNKKKYIFAVVSAIAGLYIYYLLFKNYYWTSTFTVWAGGAAADILLGNFLYVVINEGLYNLYGKWALHEDTCYEEWDKEWKRQQKILFCVGIVFFIISMFYFRHIIRVRRYGYIYNYAMGYLIAVSAVAFYGLCQFCVISFMKSKLHLVMENTSQINRENFEKAVEIERQSIERANKSEQLKIDLISNVSHDLKTPLTSMVGYLELLKMEELNPAAKDYVEVISDKAEKLKEMIESLFSLAKASSGNMLFTYETIELNRLIEQIFADMEDTIAESQLQFVKIFTSEDTHFVSDNIYIYRICQNLIENAVKYSAKGTRVFIKTDVKVDEQGKRIYVEIINTAAYYMDFTKEDIVERFARGDKARTSDGNGLGLAIVSTYANALGGKFDIEIDCDQFKAKLDFPCERT